MNFVVATFLGILTAYTVASVAQQLAQRKIKKIGGIKHDDEE